MKNLLSKQNAWHKPLLKTTDIAGDAESAAYLSLRKSRDQQVPAEKRGSGQGRVCSAGGTAEVKIIAGLGNPGREYENTKHNAGFMALDVLADRLGISISKLKFKALIGDGRIGNEKVILVKPQTYMNLSGESIREIVAFYKIDTEDLIVIYDDIDIPVGTLRIRGKGSAGTHNGMRSVVSQLQDDGFPRIRVGIGGDKGEGEIVKYVLSGFSGEEKDKVKEAVLKAADAAECIVTDGVAAAMNRYNTRKKKKKKNKEEGRAETDSTGIQETAVQKTVLNPDRRPPAADQKGFSSSENGRTDLQERREEITDDQAEGRGNV